MSGNQDVLAQFLAAAKLQQRTPVGLMTEAIMGMLRATHDEALIPKGFSGQQPSRGLLLPGLDEKVRRYSAQRGYRPGAVIVLAMRASINRYGTPDQKPR